MEKDLICILVIFFFLGSSNSFDPHFDEDLSIRILVIFFFLGSSNSFDPLPSPPADSASKR